MDNSNITEQKREGEGENPILMQQQFMDALMSNSPFHLSFDLSGDGMIYEDHVHISEPYPLRAEAIMELPVHFEAFFQKWYELYDPHFEKTPDENIFTEYYLKEAFARNEHLIDTVIKQKTIDFDGNYIFMQIFIILTENYADNHINVCVIWRDISAFRQKTAENSMELMTDNKMLREAYETANKTSYNKTNFLAQMSHEIRTPMNTIIGMAAIASKHIYNHERVRHCISRITNASRYMLTLLNDIVDMSDIESGTLKLEESTFNIINMLDNLNVLCHTMASEYEHSFNVTHSEIEHKHVIGDSLRLQQIFMNISSNSIKYTPNGGTISVSVTELPSDKAGKCCFRFNFKDNGIGIEHDYIGHIFEPFVRAKDYRVDKIQGSGLGLPITKTLIEMMEGNINVNSLLDKGTSIDVTIYLKYPVEKEEEKNKDERPICLTKEEFDS